MTPKAATVESVRTATINDVPGVARVLSRAFHNDPFFRWLFPDDNRRMAQSARAFALIAGFGSIPDGHTTVYEVKEDRGHPPVVRGAALWTPPEASGERLPVVLRSLPHWLALVGLARVPEIVRYLGELRASAPEEAHWYLSVLGTAPVARGTGVGSRLLRAGLAQADADGVPVYLETMNSANIGYYEKYGFRVIRAINDPSFPSTYCMLRPSV
ncbi:N-acetyltransferase [Nocardiopsis sp. L17-MgMaSL7]|uniref:GNAT family N-acetyltransferase n=1 Tax=Nocardiopsis sp. L17-MgMaSL7 TaxID=1938893 RepID=UPI000D70C79A|nr:GNAT family N-acetyltransferase [Nocardiopsis sp. L17-MgMaSL7]PWV44376.1 acetyltransferase (GNAT) family protein [Nocardiopsis sp. L17-MgMaSL7]